jgi:DNA-binding response OmpR family regulator
MGTQNWPFRSDAQFVRAMARSKSFFWSRGPMQRVLIVEDDVMIADCLEEFLLEARYHICGIAGSVADAIRLGEQYKPDLAVIDLRLTGGGFGTEVAAALCANSTLGVLYVSGNPDHAMLANAAGHGCIPKPYTQTAVVAALRVVGEIRAKVETLSELPFGFRQLNA